MSVLALSRDVQTSVRYDQNTLNLGIENIDGDDGGMIQRKPGFS